MCYNSQMSFTFATIGILITAYILKYKFRIKKTGIQYVLIFYTIMELLQGIQYFFINQCSNLWNIYLTEVAYILVILQPLIWNIFYYKNSNLFDKQIFITAICFSIVWIIVNVLSRVLYDKTKIPNSEDKFGSPQTQDNSIFGSDKVCTKKKITHLYWEWTSANFLDLNANMLTYLMIWFIPGLVSSRFRKSSLVLISSALFAAYVTYLTKESFVFTSLWCYISVPIVLAVIFLN